jgi:hypothetical protein
MSESLNAEFESYVKAELGDIAVVSEGRFISPKIQNYFKIWSFLEAIIFKLQLENESLKQVARFETDVAAQAIADFEAMKIEVEALRKDAAWQPIETAPKDGTEIIVGRLDIPTKNANAVITGCVGVTSFLNGKWVLPEEPELRGVFGDYVEYVDVTHWMPLPKLPIAGEAT